jgi:hypothetical protein
MVLHIAEEYEDDQFMSFIEGQARDLLLPGVFALLRPWGKSASDSGLGSPVRYRLMQEELSIGFFQGIRHQRARITVIVAGSTSSLGSLSESSSQNLNSRFLRLIQEKEKADILSVFLSGSNSVEGFKGSRCFTLLMALQPSEQVLLSKISRKRRHSIDRAIAAGVEVEGSGASSDQSFQTAYKIINETESERGIGVTRTDYVHALHRNFNASGNRSVIFIATKGGIPIATSHVLFQGRAVHLWKAGSTQMGYKLEAQSLIQREIIKWSKKTGFEYYDMGGTDPLDKKYLGIHTFKSSFGGTLLEYSRVTRKTFRGATGEAAYSSLARALRIAGGVFHA